MKRIVHCFYFILVGLAIQPSNSYAWQGWYLKAVNTISSIGTRAGWRGIKNSLKGTIGIRCNCQKDLAAAGVNVEQIAKEIKFPAPIVCEYLPTNACNSYQKDSSGCYHLYISGRAVDPRRKDALTFSIARSMREIMDNNRWQSSFFSLLSTSCARFFDKRADLLVASHLTNGINCARSFYTEYAGQMSQARRYCGSVTLENMLCEQATHEPSLRPIRATMESRWARLVRWLQPNLTKTVGEVIDSQGDLSYLTVNERMGYLRDLEDRSQHSTTRLARWTTLWRTSKPLPPSEWCRYDSASNGDTGRSQNSTLEQIALLRD